MEKVCIITNHSFQPGDKRTLLEIEALAKAGLKVIVITPMAGGAPALEERSNHQVIRAQTLRLSHNLKTKLKRGKAGNNIIFNCTVRSSLLVLCAIATLIDRLLQYLAMFSEAKKTNSAYYHSHHTLATMIIAYLVAIATQSRFLADFNDIIILHLHPKSAKGYYEQAEAWEKALTECELNRIYTTITAVRTLRDIKTILDVGCGDGRISNLLKRDYRVVSMDLSREALSRVQTHRIQASIEHIPLKDESFDLVIATEVIEHLPYRVYLRALFELGRVSKEYILIGVPYKEQLSRLMCRCTVCGCKFHVNYHQRSFTLRSLTKLFPEYKLISYIHCGATRVYYKPILLWLKRSLGGIWAKGRFTVCPSCHTQQSLTNLPEKNPISRYCDRHGILDDPTCKSHIVALYRRC